MVLAILGLGVRNRGRQFSVCSHRDLDVTIPMEPFLD